MSMSKFATYAEYAASVQPINRDAVLEHVAAMAAEAKMHKEAALWREFAKLNPVTAASLAAKLDEQRAGQ